MTNKGQLSENRSMKADLKTLLFIALLSMATTIATAMPIPPGPLSRQVNNLADQADLLLEQGHFRAAAQQYQQAMDLLPKPLTQWSACAWLAVSLGDSYFFAGDYQSAQATLERAMDCPGAHGNPYAHLRLGQVQLELGHCEQAADELTFALANGGLEIFEGESPRYLEFAANLLSFQTGPQRAQQC